MPTVSVVIPTYKHRDFVRAMLNSVFAQTHTDYEVFAVNDGSPDDTAEVLRPLVEAGRIRYIAQENQGQAAARNRGIAPLRFGASMKGKVTEAMAAGTPVVTMTIGVQGLNAVSGKHLMLGDEPPCLLNLCGCHSPKLASLQTLSESAQRRNLNPVFQIPRSLLRRSFHHWNGSASPVSSTSSCFAPLKLSKSSLRTW